MRGTYLPRTRRNPDVWYRPWFCGTSGTLWTLKPKGEQDLTFFWSNHPLIFANSFLKSRTPISMQRGVENILQLHATISTDIMPTLYRHYADIGRVTYDIFKRRRSAFLSGDVRCILSFLRNSIFRLRLDIQLVSQIFMLLS